MPPLSIPHNHHTPSHDIQLNLLLPHLLKQSKNIRKSTNPRVSNYHGIPRNHILNHHPVKNLVCFIHHSTLGIHVHYSITRKNILDQPTSKRKPVNPLTLQPRLPSTHQSASWKNIHNANSIQADSSIISHPTKHFECILSITTLYISSHNRIPRNHITYPSLTQIIKHLARLIQRTTPSIHCHHRITNKDIGLKPTCTHHGMDRSASTKRRNLATSFENKREGIVVGPQPKYLHSSVETKHLLEKPKTHGSSYQRVPPVDGDMRRSKALEQRNGLNWSVAGYVGADEVRGRVREALNQDLLMEELGLD
jgi:hypothetical protein